MGEGGSVPRSGGRRDSCSASRVPNRVPAPLSSCWVPAPLSQVGPCPALLLPGPCPALLPGAGPRWRAWPSLAGADPCSGGLGVKLRGFFQREVSEALLRTPAKRAATRESRRCESGCPSRNRGYARYGWSAALFMGVFHRLNHAGSV